MRSYGQCFEEQYGLVGGDDCLSGKVQWNFSIEDIIGTQLAVLYREVSPDSEVDLYTALCGWDCRHYPH